MVVTDDGKPALEIRPYRAAAKRDPLEVLRSSVFRLMSARAAQRPSCSAASAPQPPA